MTADMAHVLARRSPLGATTRAENAVGATDGLEIVELPFLTQWNLRGAPSATLLDALEASTGVRPPITANRQVHAASHQSVIWLAPDEWLLVGPEGALAPLSDVLAVVRPAGGSLVDVSAHRTVLELRGPGARDVLASGCSVDLHPRVFAVGHAVQTQFARADVLLGRVADNAYQVFVRASFARYLADWLSDALGVEGGTP